MCFSSEEINAQVFTFHQSLPVFARSDSCWLGTGCGYFLPFLPHASNYSLPLYLPIGTNTYLNRHKAFHFLPHARLLFPVHLHTYPCICLSFCPSICLSACQFIMPINPSVCPHRGKPSTLLPPCFTLSLSSPFSFYSPIHTSVHTQGYQSPYTSLLPFIHFFS